MRSIRLFLHPNCPKRFEIAKRLPRKLSELECSAPRRFTIVF